MKGRLRIKKSMPSLVMKPNAMLELRAISSASWACTLMQSVSLQGNRRE